MPSDPTDQDLARATEIARESLAGLRFTHNTLLPIHVVITDELILDFAEPIAKALAEERERCAKRMESEGEVCSQGEDRALFRRGAAAIRGSK